MNNTNATPLPWHQAVGAPKYYIFGPDTTQMMQSPDLCATATTDDNAALIVRAVNNHAALVEACESVLESLEHHLADEFLPETRAVLRAAIAAAKGEA